jgi:predicted Rossmann-fold nucleotide-binding protein
MKKICVFTGAAMGENPIYAKSAYQLGQMIASRQLGLVYGGGKMGLMGRVADGVIEAGGLGTLDETMEIATWRQLGLHQKPIIVFNLNGYWQHLLDQIQHIIDAGFMHHGNVKHLEQANTLDEIADHLDNVANGSLVAAAISTATSG